MIISTFGSRFYGGQIDRIDYAFLQLGHVLGNHLNNEPNFIYCNDAAHFDEALKYWEDKDRFPKLILNILDVPHWVKEWPQIKEKWLLQLQRASKVTCISNAVRMDIKNYLNIEAAVVYNPIKPVYYVPEIKKDILALFVGRALAPNKRVMEIVYPLYQRLSPFFGENCIHFAGSENTGFGVNHGVVSDYKLNVLYNRATMLLIPSKQEGLNLPLIEGLSCGCLPIVCRDMSTASEFAPEFTLCDPTPEGMYNKMKELCTEFKETFKYDDILNDYSRKYLNQFAPKSIAENIISVYNNIA